MRRKKWTLRGLMKVLAVLIIVASLVGFFILRQGMDKRIVPVKSQTGYKTEDRKKLEQLIHEGAQHD